MTLLIIALALLLSAVGDLLVAANPATCENAGAGGPSCITIGPAGVLIDGVDFIGTLRDAILGGIVTVFALFLDVVEYFLKE